MPLPFFCSLCGGKSAANFEASGLAHSASLEELDDVEDFLKQRLPPVGDKKTADDGKSEL